MGKILKLEISLTNAAILILFTAEGIWYLSSIKYYIRSVFTTLSVDFPSCTS